MTRLETLLEQVRALPVSEQQRLAHLILMYLYHPPASGPEAGHKLSDLAGIGADLWQGIDAQEYLRQERATWDF